MEIDIKELQLLPGDEVGLDIFGVCGTITCSTGKTCSLSCVVTQ